MKKNYAFLMGAIVICTLFVGCSAEPVEVTIPFEMGFMTNEPTIIIIAEQETKNDDGSVTYVMTKANYSNLLDSVETFIETTITEILTSKDFPEIFEEIEFSDDYTTLTVKMNDALTNQGYSLALIAIMGMSTLHQQIAGVEIPSSQLIISDAATGEVVFDEIM